MGVVVVVGDSGVDGTLSRANDLHGVDWDHKYGFLGGLELSGAVEGNDGSGRSES